LIRFAYNVQQFRVVGGPDWVRADRFEINAKAPRAVSSEEMQLMLQSLLEERFKLVTRKDQREMQFFALALARRDGRLGPDIEQCQDAGAAKPPKMPAAPPAGRVELFVCAPIESITSLATAALGRPVVDTTGLRGLWTFKLTTPMEAKPIGPGRIPASAEKPPGLSTALQEQLGLRLESTRGPVDVLVIDSVQQPSEN
jgi:uncharacterized protein (TIGR03435 family)